MTFQAGLMNGKCAFVAGGTSGINKGIALRLSEAGAKVAGWFTIPVERHDARPAVTVPHL